MQDELREVFGDSDRPCTIEDVPKLKYLECCIKESLRLYPPVPIITRYISENTELDGYRVPAGVSLSMLIYALHRNEEYFPEPLTFKPERFQMEESVGRHPFAFVPFSAGSRNCIGKSIELKFMISNQILTSNEQQAKDSPCLKKKCWPHPYYVDLRFSTTQRNMDNQKPTQNSYWDRNTECR